MDFKVCRGFLFMGLMALGTACTTQSCKRQEIEQKNKEGTGLESAGTSTSAPNIWIYKYDGELQCQKGSGKSLETMRNEDLQGITVVEMEKRRDNLMYNAACGRKQGTANAYLIPASELEKALERGFRVWNFDEPE